VINKIRSKSIEYYIKNSHNLFFDYQYGQSGVIDVYFFNQFNSALVPSEKPNGLKQRLEKLLLKNFLLLLSKIDENKKPKLLRIKTFYSICLDVIESNVEEFGSDIFKIKYLLSIEYSDLIFEKKLFKFSNEEKISSNCFFDSVKMTTLKTIENLLASFVPKKIKERIKQRMFRKNYKADVMNKFLASSLSESFEEFSVRNFLKENYFDCKNGVWINKKDPCLVYIENQAFFLPKPLKKLSNSQLTSTQVQSIISYWVYSNFKQSLNQSRVVYFPEY
jgi:hypothetical protein